jgi:hypothetical protein
VWCFFLVWRPSIGSPQPPDFHGSSHLARGAFPAAGVFRFLPGLTIVSAVRKAQSLPAPGECPRSRLTRMSFGGADMSAIWEVRKWLKSNNNGRNGYNIRCRETYNPLGSQPFQRVACRPCGKFPHACDKSCDTVT